MGKDTTTDLSEPAWGGLPNPNALRRERRFKAAVAGLHALGIFPSPTAIKTILGGSGTMNRINGEQTRWRREEFKRLGYVKKEPQLLGNEDVQRWVSPSQGRCKTCGRCRP